MNYDSGFGDKWMIENQIKGTGNLNFDPAKGKVVAPWLSWGPYQWADGIHPRSDGLVWLPSDFLAYSWGGIDWAHPSHAGVRKETDQLLAFFKTDPTTTPWFLRKTSEPPELNVTAFPPSGKAPLKVNFSAEARSAHGIAETVWTFDDGCYSISPAPVKTFYVPGKYRVHVTVTDRRGNAATRTVTVTVEGRSSPPAKGVHSPPALVPPAGHKGPTVKIVRPETGAKFADPKQILITADVTHGDARVTRVDFFKGGEARRGGPWRIWIGKATTSPYAATWQWDPAYEHESTGGQFVLVARVLDNLGGAGEDQVRITISHGKTREAPIKKAASAAELPPLRSQNYSTYASWEAMDQATNAHYATVIRVSGTNRRTSCR